MDQSSTTLPKQFKNLMGMGSAVQVFPPKVLPAVNIIFAVLFLLGGGGAIAYALLILLQRWGRYYPPVILQAMAPWLIGGLLGIVLAALLMWNLYTARKKGIAVFTHGFAYSDRKGVQTWRWDQLQDETANVTRHYTNGIYTGTTHVYTLVKLNGEKLVVNDSIKEVESFYTLLQNNTLQHRYQRLADAYNRGEPAIFGPVTISKTGGLQIGKKTYPWDEIEQVGINKGVLSVKKKGGGWFSGASATAGSIPNLHVLLSIINQIVGLNAG
jgi:hypothetical protein